jgi:chromosome segregation ATPase
MEQAKVLTYENQHACRTVTMSGEDYNPRGTMTGGSRTAKASVLKSIHELSGKYARVEAINQRLDEINGNLFSRKYLIWQMNVA